MPAHVPVDDWLLLSLGGVGLILLGVVISRRAAPGTRAVPQETRM